MTVAVLNWVQFLKNKRIVLLYDNEAVVHMINNSSSRCKNCIVLIRLIVLEGLLHNVRVFIKPDMPINVYAQSCLFTAKYKFSLVSPVAD